LQDWDTGSSGKTRDLGGRVQARDSSRWSWGCKSPAGSSGRAPGTVREQKTIRASEEDPQKLNRLQLITKAVLALIFRIKFFNAKTIQLKITITDGKYTLL